MNWSGLQLSIPGLHDHYRRGDFTPAQLLRYLEHKAQQFADYNIWIHHLTEAEWQPYLARLERGSPATLPLYGVPFAIKDNIDLEGVATTAACPEFAYVPASSAVAVERLVAAGAIPVGKTNLDQFATGLNGTRSPYGICRNAYNPRYISGGSSSGSAVAVALGLASFSLGTDTAGSGRVPAALNNLLGVKPSRGLWSTRGMVPACRSLDCVNVFTTSVTDAGLLSNQLTAFDPLDPFSRRAPASPPARPAVVKIGVPRQLEFFGDAECAELFARARRRWTALAAETVSIDFAPLLEAATLLYEGPWLAERQISMAEPLARYPEAIHPAVKTIVDRADGLTAADAFRGFYRLAAIKRHVDALFEQVDLLLMPTYGKQFTIDDLLAEPIAANSQLGYYTNFMNLLDLCALALPAGFSTRGVPFGVTLAAPAFRDAYLLDFASASAGPL